MRRREFMTLVGGVAAWPLAARAQQRATQSRIAIFHPAIPTTLLTETGGGSAWRAFFAELRRLGYVEGQNLIIERLAGQIGITLVMPLGGKPWLNAVATLARLPACCNRKLTETHASGRETTGIRQHR